MARPTPGDALSASEDALPKDFASKTAWFHDRSYDFGSVLQAKSVDQPLKSHMTSTRALDPSPRTLEEALPAPMKHHMPLKILVNGPCPVPGSKQCHINS